MLRIFILLFSLNQLFSVGFFFSLARSRSIGQCHLIRIMSLRNDICLSTFESLPNELLIEFFEYLSPLDLYEIFYNLNSRFRSLILSLQNLHLILHEDWDDRINKHSIPPYASQISTLIIRHDDSLDLSSFINLRALKLSMPTAEQCNSIHSTCVSNLEHLFISNLFFADHSEQLCRWIFSSKFSHLRTCRIDRITFNSYSNYCSLSLRHLTISPCTWKKNLYEQIFSSCPNLTYLSIIRLRNVSFKLLPNQTFKHTSLRHLNMQFFSIGNDWYRHIRWLLSIVTNLEHFRLNINQNENDFEFPFEAFARLLNEHVEYLKDFQLKIPLNHFQMTDFDFITRLHPLFSHGHINQDEKNSLIISSR